MQFMLARISSGYQVSKPRKPRLKGYGQPSMMSQSARRTLNSTVSPHPWAIGRVPELIWEGRAGNELTNECILLMGCIANGPQIPLLAAPRAPLQLYSSELVSKFRVHGQVCLLVRASDKLKSKASLAQRLEAGHPSVGASQILQNECLRRSVETVETVQAKRYAGLL